ncbi:MAG: hypothetical protein AAF211_16950 [Myxococcota bacterium]
MSSLRPGDRRSVSAPSVDKPRKPTPNGRVKPHPSTFDVGAPIAACTVGSGRLVAVVTRPGDDETPPVTVCQVHEVDDALYLHNSDLLNPFLKSDF